MSGVAVQASQIDAVKFLATLVFSAVTKKLREGNFEPGPLARCCG